MRSIWFLILFGSLITYHCLTTVSGEKPSTQAAAKKPSFTQCKKYVDAALSSAEAEARKKAGIVGGKPPDGSDTDATEEDPNATEEDPNATEEDETDATEEDPNATEEDPNATEEEECDATEEDPNATEEDPNATEEEETDATEEDPNATEEDPNATEEDETDATEEDPNATEEDPNATEEEETDATEEDPNATEEDPNATEEDETDATEEDPNATEEDPNATEEDETDATEEDPNATEEDPNATEEEETDATEEDPNATEEDPNATEEEETDATEEDPNATEEDPNATEEEETDATEEDPNATEEDPNATEEEETDATEEDPNATEEDPNATEEEETDATEEDPNATEEDPNATEEEETDATEEDPNATEEDPNATEEEETDATEEDPNATEEDPNATEEDETDATEEDPNATEEDPNATEEEETDATEEDPNATEEDPNATEEDETDATEEDPNATEEDPNATEEEETDATEEDPNATEEDPNATEEESSEHSGGEVTSEEDQKSDEDDKSANGNAKKDSGKKAKSNGPLPGHVASKAHQSQSGKIQTDKTAQKARASAKDAVSPEAEDGVSDEDDEDDEEEEEAEPYEPRSRDHITQILGLDDSDQTKTTFNMLDKVTQATLKELKNTYENAIKPLEQLYKYRDLSNRHFGDPEIFSKPLIVFMGPWSGGKSTIINWLLGIQHEEHALRTGADPSPAQFNIMMYGKEAEKLDGTQLAADWTFSGLQKFGQSFLDRLRGQKLPNRLLEKVNIVEIPGILEVRKQVERSFPFNDACQWFIDRADTLFLIYDPAKLDIGPETEAILDQLKGRESQVRIVLNKADTVKPDELLRVQAMLVWNISPLMSSAEPPVMYAASLWDRPLQVESPKSLLVAHEHNFLKDIRDGIERRVETRIAAARRFAVRVRNHAKMTDCYLNTYLNHKSFFGDKKKITNDILDHPQNYHIYEGLSTLTNISRYDLPDPDTYRDFFRLNPLWDFPTLQSTCSFWKGCPLNKLDMAIAYELPEILGKFRRQRESILTAQSQKSSKH